MVGVLGSDKFNLKRQKNECKYVVLIHPLYT